LAWCRSNIRTYCVHNIPFYRNFFGGALHLSSRCVLLIHTTLLCKTHQFKVVCRTDNKVVCISKTHRDDKCKVYSLSS
jgi:hypothetical protein